MNIFNSGYQNSSLVDKDLFFSVSLLISTNLDIYVVIHNDSSILITHVYILDGNKKRKKEKKKMRKVYYLIFKST